MVAVVNTDINQPIAAAMFQNTFLHSIFTPQFSALNKNVRVQSDRQNTNFSQSVPLNFFFKN